MTPEQLATAERNVLLFAEELVRRCFMNSLGRVKGKDVNKQLKALGNAVGQLRCARHNVAPDSDAYPFYTLSGKPFFGEGSIWEGKEPRPELP